MPSKRAPAGCYWRGTTLWGRATVKDEEYRWSLRTGDPKIAAIRCRAEKDRLVAQHRFGDDRKTWGTAIEEWARYAEKNLSPTTLLRYGVSLKQVDAIMSGLFLDEINRAAIAALIRDRRAKVPDISNATLRRDLTALSSVLGFCEGQEWIDGNPALAMLRHLKERRDPIVLPETADIEAVIARAPGLFSAMIAAAWHTGCRQEELASLERSRVDLRRRQATIIGKGNKLRTIELHGAYEVLRGVTASLRSKFVFWHGEGQRYANVSSRFAELTTSAQKSALSEGREFRRFRFHHLRHRFAVDYLKNRLGTIYDLKDHLGHKSITTTELYLKYLTPDEARAAKGTPAQTAAHLQRFGTEEVGKSGA